MNFGGRAARVLDFDSENIPGFYWHDGITTDYLHTIACAWLDEPSDNHVWQLRWGAKLGLHFPVSSFESFRRLTERADIVTAHNASRHDVPLFNAYADRHHIPRIRWPRVVDTLTDIQHTKGMPRNQEFLADRDGTSERKMHVGLYTWEQAARGVPEAMKIVADRCLSDVFSHIELYRKQYGVT